VSAVLERGVDCDSNAGRYLMFHGGSGSTKEEINTAVGNGIYKMNVDTDTQYSYLVGIRVHQQILFLIVIHCFLIS
jgi:fructose/tagatose bisphosphate aldolase